MVDGSEVINEEEQTGETLTRRSLLRRSLGIGLGLPVAMVVLQACGGDDDEEDSADPVDEVEDAAGTAEEEIEEVTDDEDATPEDTSAVDPADDTSAADAGAPTSESLPQPPGA